MTPKTVGECKTRTALTELKRGGGSSIRTTSSVGCFGGICIPHSGSSKQSTWDSEVGPNATGHSRNTQITRNVTLIPVTSKRSERGLPLTGGKFHTRLTLLWGPSSR